MMGRRGGVMHVSSYGRGFKSKNEVYEMVDACPMGAEEALAKKLVDGVWSYAWINSDYEYSVHL